MANILLAGYLGCGNLGDDAVMLGIVNRLGNTHRYMIMSGDPDETYRQHNVPSIPRKNPKAVDSAMSDCDAVLFPGGSIFQDATSIGSALYYHGIVKMARKKKKRVLLLNQGVGPLNSILGKKYARDAFNMADLITVRDPGSAALLAKIGVTKKVHVGADSAYLLPEPPVTREGEMFNVGGMKVVGVSVRPYPDKKVNEVEIFGDFCRLLFQNGFAPTLIEMDSAEDGAVIEAICKHQGGKVPSLRRLGNPRAVQERIGRMEAIVAMRLHAGILATTVGIPPLMLNYDPKVAAFAKLLDIGNSVSMEGLTGVRLYEAFQTHLQNQASKVPVILRRKAELEAQAMKAVTMTLELLK